MTVTDPAGAGFLTVYPCGTSRPTASNLNFVAGQTIPNAVLAKVGRAATVCVFTSTSTDIIVDVNGYFPAGTTVHGVGAGAVVGDAAGG